MNKLTLIRIPEVIPTTSNAYTTPPVGLAYLAAYCIMNGYIVKIIDALGEGLSKYTQWNEYYGLVLHGITCEQIVEKIDPEFSGVIGISNMFSQDWPLARNIIKGIKTKYPDAKIVLGGEHVTALPEFCLRDAKINGYCVVGEGEEAFVGLLDVLNNKKNINEVGGIGYLDEQGKYVMTSSKKRITNIDELPYPAWDLVPLENYLSSGSGFGVDKGRNMPLVATRGCPYACTFCSNPHMWSQRWVARDPKKVVDEMQHWIKVYSANNFDFYDLTAIIRKEWIIDFCKELVSRNVNVTWQLPSGTRSEAIDEEVVVWLKKAGCCQVVYAPESGSEMTLKRIQKKVNIPNLFASMRAAVKQGLFVKMNIVLGFPDDKLSDVLRTYWFLLKCALIGVHDVFIYTFTPYPGSALFTRLRSEGKINELSDAYLYDLSTYTKVSEAIAYTDFLSSRQLSFFKFFGMLYYYVLVFMCHPSYAVHVVRNLLSGETDTHVEGMIRGILLPWKKQFRGLVFLRRFNGMTKSSVASTK